MTSIYTNHDLALAMEASWEVLRQLSGIREGVAQAMETLMKNHPCLAEIDESGAAGYVGIGLGNYGGHAV